MAAKRAVKAKEEAKEAKANEAIRRKSGKVSPSTELTVRVLNKAETLGHQRPPRRTEAEGAYQGGRGEAQGYVFLVGS